MPRVLSFGLLAGALLAAAYTAAQESASRNDQITPEILGLSRGNVRTSQPFVVRRYKANPDDPEKVAEQQPTGFVKTIEDGYKLAGDETFRVHEGVDFSSRPAPGMLPAPVEFKAGVYGRVIKAGGGTWNTITVQLADGSVVQYLHASKVIVAVGQQVSPDTVLGLTGKKGTTTIHLHVQARGKDGKSIHPDKAFASGQRMPATTTDWPEAKWADFDIEAQSRKVPNVKSVDGTVRITYDDNAPKGKGSAAKADAKGKAAAANPLVGTWKGTGTTDRGKKFSGTLTLAEGGTATYAGDLIQPDGSAKVATVSGTWVRAGDAVQITWKGAVQPVTLKLSGNTLTDRIPNTPAGNLTLTFEKQ
jgi:hypothetical protein